MKISCLVLTKIPPASSGTRLSFSESCRHGEIQSNNAWQIFLLEHSSTRIIAKQSLRIRQRAPTFRYASNCMWRFTQDNKKYLTAICYKVQCWSPKLRVETVLFHVNFMKCLYYRLYVTRSLWLNH